MRSVKVLMLAGVLCGAAVLLHTSREGAPVFGDERARGSTPVATIGRVAISKQDLADYWFDRYPEEYGRTLNALIDERIVSDRARRWHITVSPGALDKAVQTEVDARRKQLQEMYGKAVSLDTEVQRAYGVNLAAWQREILRPRLRMAMLLNRVVRLDTRARDTVQARVIVMTDRARADGVARKLRSGADFSLIALRESEDPTASKGGQLPLISRGDLAFPGVEARLFEARSGQILGPLEVMVEGKPQFHIYKVIRRLSPWRGDLATLGRRLEQDLDASPVTRSEFERWRARSRRGLGVKLFRPDGRVWAAPEGRSPGPAPPLRKRPRPRSPRHPTRPRHPRSRPRRSRRSARRRPRRSVWKDRSRRCFSPRATSCASTACATCWGWPR